MQYKKFLKKKSETTVGKLNYGLKVILNVGKQCVFNLKEFHPLVAVNDLFT